MGPNPDFRDLLFELNAADARYLIVGGYAVAFHGRPRFTKDLCVGRRHSGPAARVPQRAGDSGFAD